jgi:1,4-dihydroxy-2-naphthoyl-CoA hydrolase
MDPDQLLELIPFARTLGIELETATAEEVRAATTWSPERCTAAGVLHGGVLMALADTVGAVCAFLNLPEDTQTTTITSATTFVRAVRQGSVTAVARPLHAGRRVIAVQTALTNEENKLVAQVTQTQAVLPVKT